MSPRSSNLFSALNGFAPDAAKRLLGCELKRTLDDGTILRAKIVETEAYDESDPGSHSHRGKTLRNNVMFGPAGVLYVYFIYGMHFCCNIVTGPKGRGEAVLIRAVEPLDGETIMRTRRKGLPGTAITNGPSKLCQALGITRLENAHNLTQPPLQLIMKPPLDPLAVTQTQRIGLSQGKDTPWRFYITGDPYISKP